MPSTKSKSKNATTQRAQTKSGFSLASLKKKKGFRLWLTVLSVGLIAAVGFTVVNYSQASSHYAYECYALHTKADPNTTNKCVGSQFASGNTGDLITVSDFPTYSGFTGRYTTGDQICVEILSEVAPRVIIGPNQYAPTPQDRVSVALTLKSNPATRKELTVRRYGAGGNTAGFKCAPLVGSGYDYRDATTTPGGIQVKVLTGPIKKLRVFVSHSSDRPVGGFLDVFRTEGRSSR